VTSVAGGGLLGTTQTTIGIIGSGNLGSNLARMFARRAVTATIANGRDPASLAPLITEVGPSIKAGTVREAASASIVLVAIRWVDLPKVLAPLSPWNGRIVVDATNPVEFLDPKASGVNDPTNPLAVYGIKAVDLGGRYSSEVFRELVRGARVVKAFNHLSAKTLSQPEAAGGRRVLFYSGDDDAAKADVKKLIEKTGFFPVDLGKLDVGGPLASPPFGPLGGADFIKL
jgi:predicted dinucleotide-binding enzyme